VLSIVNGKKVPLTPEEGIQHWLDTAEKFEKTHPGFRANFLLCAVKRMGEEKIHADIKHFVTIFNTE